MEKNEIIDILDQKINTVVISGVNNQRSLSSSVVNIVIENRKIYFFLAAGHELYTLLKNSPIISLIGYHNSTSTLLHTVSLSGKIQEISQSECNDKIKKDKMIYRLYKNSKSLNILHGFEIYEYQGEYIEYGQDCIRRDYFSSSTPISALVYQVSNQCIYCKACYRVCPQQCIDVRQKPVKINIHRCLQCGKCAQICPRRAITKTQIHI